VRLQREAWRNGPKGHRALRRPTSVHPILRGPDRVLAWIIPNTAQATQQRLDGYLVTVEELEERTGEVFPEVPAYAKADKPERSWLIPIGCNRG
jgi:endonuclease G